MEPTPSRPPPGMQRTLTPSLKDALSLNASLVSPAPFRLRQVPQSLSSSRSSDITLFKVRHLENELQRYKLATETAEAKLEMERLSIQTEFRTDKARIEALNKDVRFLLDRNDELEKAVNDLQERIKNLRTQHHNEIQTLRAENIALQARVDMEAIEMIKRSSEDDRIRDFEAVIKSLREDLSRLSNANKTDGKRKRDTFSTDSVKGDADPHEFILKENEFLREKIATLERELGAGGFNSDVVQVVQLKDNPAKEEFEARTTLLANLRKENQELLCKLMSSPIIGLREVPEQVVVNMKKEIEQLQKTVAEKEKRMLRLKEIWKEKSLEFREAIYSLLGYKVDFLENGRLRLTSIFAEEDDHSFIFTSNENDYGTLQLSGGGNQDFLESVRDLLEYWVHERKNIVLFLAAFQLEAADKQERKERQVMSYG